MRPRLARVTRLALPRFGIPVLVAMLASASACGASSTGAETSTPASDDTASSSASAPTAPGSSAPASTATADTTTTPPPPAQPAPPASSQQGCDPDPMVHVYNPERLHVLDACLTVSGSVALVRPEADGDYHVRLVLDSGQTCDGQDCLDAGNRSGQGGGLVVEIVCAHGITQADATSACLGYHTMLAIPTVGQHLTVTGPWVFDADHGWNEIHPAEAFGGQPAPPAAAPQPTPAPGSATALAVTITASRYGHVAATTSPGAICSATAKLPSGRTSTASGLQAQQTAGADGGVSWTYGTSSTTTHGTGTHTVTCSLGGQTATSSAPFSVP